MSSQVSDGRSLRNCVVFLHIEKAAGSTMHDIMYANFLPYYVATPVKYEKGRGGHGKHVTAEQLREIMFPHARAAGGHALRCFGDYESHNLRPLFLTFLRDPISRYLSHFFYQREVMGIGWTFEDFLADPYFADFMCKKLTPAGTAEAANALIEERQVFVGLVEHFDESLWKFGERLRVEGLSRQFDCRYVVKNSSVDRGRGHADEARMLLDAYGERVRLNNAEDISLYEHHLARWTALDPPEFAFRVSRNSAVAALRIAAGKAIRRLWFVPRERRVGYRAE